MHTLSAARAAAHAAASLMKAPLPNRRSRHSDRLF